MAGLFGGTPRALNSSFSNSKMVNTWNSNNTTYNAFGSDGDSVIGSSTDPTPTHKAKSR